MKSKASKDKKIKVIEARQLCPKCDEENWTLNLGDITANFLYHCWSCGHDFDKLRIVFTVDP